MARKKKHEEHANHERWLVSFADFMTLLFALFVVMFAVSKTDADKVGRFTESAQHAFHLITTPMESGNVNLSVGPKGNKGEMGTGQVGSGFMGTMEKGTGGFPIAEFMAFMESMDKPAPAGAPEMGDAHAAAAAKAFQEELEQALGGGEGLHIRFLKDERGFVVSLGGEELFEAGSAAVRPLAKKVFLGVGRRLRTLKLALRIEGHTDDAPMESAQFPSNWELSTARAASLVRVLIEEQTFPPWALSAAGFGQWKPLASNDNAEGRSANRRIDIVILGPWKEPVRPDWSKTAELPAFEIPKKS